MWQGASEYPAGGFGNGSTRGSRRSTERYASRFRARRQAKDRAPWPTQELAGRAWRRAVHLEAPSGTPETRLGRWAWETKPRLSTNPRLIGDFRKNLVFVEVQFWNSATLYRDFYKFQYGLQNGILSLSVLIVPVNPKDRLNPRRPVEKLGGL